MICKAPSSRFSGRFISGGQLPRKSCRPVCIARGTSDKEPSTEPLEATEPLADGTKIDDEPHKAVLGTPFTGFAALSTFGVSMTGYLTWSKLSNVSVACSASGGDSCQTILDSAYAQVLGVPLPLLGALAYGSIAAISFYSLSLKSKDPDVGFDTCTQLENNRKAILYGTSLLAGTSAALAVTLRTEFSETFCAYCFASILTSFALYFTALTFTPGNDRRVSVGTSLTMAVALLGIYTSYPNTSLARTYDLPFASPLVTEVSANGATDLAIKLRESGAKFYGAFWCSHCFEQKQIFGVAAAKELPYVECYPDGYHGTDSLAKVCIDANIQNFPTWIINGQTVEGDWPLPYLEDVLGGADPRKEAEKY